MGFFGKFSYDNGQWREREPGAEPYLVIDIHDSDIATIDYRPAKSASGRFYLGVEPRFYFENESANAPVDVDAEAQAFATWVGDVCGKQIATSDVQQLMANSDGGDPDDIYVEDTVVRLLTLAGLPLPEELEPFST